MKQKFELQKIINHYNLNREDIENVMFPHVRYKKQAVDRILKGEGQVTVEQVENIANFIGVCISDLFNIDTWKGCTEDKCLTFNKTPYKVKLNYKGVFLSLYKDNKLVYQEIIVPNSSIEEFLKYIDLLIKKFEENGKL